MKTFEVTIKERGNDHPLHTSYTGPDETTVAIVEAWFDVHNDDVESYEIHEVANLDEQPQEPSPMLKQYTALKAKHPDALLLFRCGDFYETYHNDADDAARILGITLTKSSKQKGPDGKPLRIAGFPHFHLDTYLPKLIRAGKRVAICDQIETPTKK